MQISFPSAQNVSNWSSALQKSTSSSGGASGSQAASSGADFALAMSGPPPGGPPPGPPPDAPDGSGSSGNGSQGMSTMQFAQRASGAAAHNDPIAALDSNDDDSVSADEFGLDSASSSVQKLFAAIDSDGSGELSKSEVTSFRDTMMAASQASDAQARGAGSGDSGSTGGTEAPHHHHGGGGGGGGGGAGDAPAGSTSADSSSSTSSADLMKQMLEKIAQRYAALSSDSATSGFFATAA